MNRKIEWLETLQEKKDSTSLLMNAVALITKGGPEGIQTVAQQQPEMIIAALSGLVDVILQQEESHLKLVEDYLELHDILETLTANLRKK